MSTPFTTTVADANPFAPAPQKEPMNAREDFLRRVDKHGWLLDTEARLTRRVRGERVSMQDPTAFLKPDGNGGTWKLKLDYTIEDNWTGATDNTLREVVLVHVAADGTRSRDYRLINTAVKRNDPVGLWEICARERKPVPRLRPLAERIVAAPELCAWLVEEKRYLDRQAYEAASRRREEQWARRKKRNAALAVTNDEFNTLGRDLRDAVYALTHVDGTTDVSEAMTTLRLRVAALENALKNGEGK